MVWVQKFFVVAVFALNGLMFAADNALVVHEPMPIFKSLQKMLFVSIEKMPQWHGTLSAKKQSFVKQVAAEGKDKALSALFNIATKLSQDMQKTVLLQLFVGRNQPEQLVERFSKWSITEALESYSDFNKVLDEGQLLSLKDEIRTAMSNYQPILFDNHAEVFRFSKEMCAVDSLLLRSDVNRTSNTWPRPKTTMYREEVVAVSKMIEKDLFGVKNWRDRSFVCSIYKKVTLARFVEQLKKKLIVKDRYSDQKDLEVKYLFCLITAVPLAIKMVSRTIELLCCKKLIKQELVQDNVMRELANTLLATDARLKQYRFLLHPITDYTEGDYLKMYAPYAGYFFWYCFWHQLLENMYAKYNKNTMFFAGLIGCVIAFVTPREKSLLRGSTLTGIFVSSVLAVNLFKVVYDSYQIQKYKVDLKDIPDLFKRTDIIIT